MSENNFDIEQQDGVVSVIISACMMASPVYLPDERKVMPFGDLCFCWVFCQRCMINNVEYASNNIGISGRRLVLGDFQ